MFLYLILLLLFLVYLWQKRTFNFWKNNGIPQIDVHFPFGLVPKSRTFIYEFQEFYDKYKGKTKFIGTYNLTQKMLMVIDEEMIKQILIKDFNHFTSRGIYNNERDDPLSVSLFGVDNPKWRILRNKLSPTFTSGKMKMMFPIILDIVEKFKEIMDQKIREGETGIDMRDMFGRYTTDVISSCAFGLECNSLLIPDIEFRKTVKKVFTDPKNSVTMIFVLFAFEKLARELHIKLIRDDISKFFIKITSDNINHRIQNKVKRNDFLDLLIELKNDKKSNSFEDSEMEGLSLNEMAAHSFLFFIAGFETSSSASSFTIYELAKNQKIQDKLRNHIREVLKKYGGKLTYEAMKDMTYLDQCFKEGLRMYPPLPLLTRKCVEPYKLPGTNVIISEGTLLNFPLYAIQNDSRHFPNPSQYDPDRFTPEEIAKRNPFVYLPFGEGPRNCIGERFGLMQAKIGLAYLIGNYRFKLNAKTSEKEVKFFTNSLVLAPTGGLYFDVERVPFE